MSSWSEYFTGSDFEQVSTRLSGSTPLSLSAKTLIKFSLFVNLEGCGAVSIRDSESKEVGVLIERTEFRECSNSFSGGAVNASFVRSSGISIVRSCFSKCVSSSSGSVIFCKGKNEVEQYSKIEFCSVCDINSTFLDVTKFQNFSSFIKSLNSSHICMQRVSGLSLIFSKCLCVFSNFCNSVQDSCCFYLDNSSLIFSNCNINYNNQTMLEQFQGIFYLYRTCTAHFNGCSFVHNTGPLIEFSSSSLTICTFCSFDTSIEESIICRGCTFNETAIINVLPNNLYCKNLIPTKARNVMHKYFKLIVKNMVVMLPLQMLLNNDYFITN